MKRAYFDLELQINESGTAVSASVTFETQEGLKQFLMQRIKERKQEGIHQHNHHQELETSIEGLQARTFQGQLAFGIAHVMRNEAALRMPVPPS